MRQLKKDWLTNCDDEREIGSKSATMREKLAHILRQFERDGLQRATMRGRLVHKPEHESEPFLAYLNIVLLQNSLIRLSFVATG